MIWIGLFLDRVYRCDFLRVCMGNTRYLSMIFEHGENCTGSPIILTLNIVDSRSRAGPKEFGNCIWHFNGKPLKCDLNSEIDEILEEVGLKIEDLPVKFVPLYGHESSVGTWLVRTMIANKFEGTGVLPIDLNDHHFEQIQYKTMDGGRAFSRR